MSFYYIESKVLSPNGKRLALTFSANEKAVAVTNGAPVERLQVSLVWLDIKYTL
jgi:hypothetical protein